MKFAVLEYTSKTGDIWRHTDARPNYVADPVREIDPTSFGCYVSALKGEHVPLTGLIVGRVSGVGKATRLYRKVTKRLRGAWPKNYSLAYLQQFDVLLAVHQLSDAHELVHLVRRLRQLQPHPFVIGVPTQPFGILKRATEETPGAREEFVQFMSHCDVFLTVVQETKSWYQRQTSTPVLYVPQPYPVEFAASNWVPPEKKQKQILVAGVTQRADIKKGQRLARALQQEFPEYEIVIPKVADLDYDTTNLAGSRYRILPFEEWREHLQTLSQVTLVINTDYTYTRGRVQTDCAAVGTPSLGANSDGQRDLFPTLASDPETSIEELLVPASRLLRDIDFYRSVTTVASERLKKYNYIESADRIRLLTRQHTLPAA